jgi:hypothetical protein
MESVYTRYVSTEYRMLLRDISGVDRTLQALMETSLFQYAKQQHDMHVLATNQGADAKRTSLRREILAMLDVDKGPKPKLVDNKTLPRLVAKETELGEDKYFFLVSESPSVRPKLLEMASLYGEGQDLSLEHLWRVSMCVLLHDENEIRSQVEKVRELVGGTFGGADDELLASLINCELASDKQGCLKQLKIAKPNPELQALVESQGEMMQGRRKANVGAGMKLIIDAIESLRPDARQELDESVEALIKSGSGSIQELVPALVPAVVFLLSASRSGLVSRMFTTGHGLYDVLANYKDISEESELSKTQPFKAQSKTQLEEIRDKLQGVDDPFEYMNPLFLLWRMLCARGQVPGCPSIPYDQSPIGILNLRAGESCEQQTLDKGDTRRARKCRYFNLYNILMGMDVKTYPFYSNSKGSLARARDNVVGMSKFVYNGARDYLFSVTGDAVRDHVGAYRHYNNYQRTLNRERQRMSNTNSLSQAEIEQHAVIKHPVVELYYQYAASLQNLLIMFCVRHPNLDILPRGKGVAKEEMRMVRHLRTMMYDTMLVDKLDQFFSPNVSFSRKGTVFSAVELLDVSGYQEFERLKDKIVAFGYANPGLIKASPFWSRRVKDMKEMRGVVYNEMLLLKYIVVVGMIQRMVNRTVYGVEAIGIDGLLHMLKAVRDPSLLFEPSTTDVSWYVEAGKYNPAAKKRYDAFYEAPLEWDFNESTINLVEDYLQHHMGASEGLDQFNAGLFLYSQRGWQKDESTGFDEKAEVGQSIASKAEGMGLGSMLRKVTKRAKQGVNDYFLGQYMDWYRSEFNSANTLVLGLHDKAQLEVHTNPRGSSALYSVKGAFTGIAERVLGTLREAVNADSEESEAESEESKAESEESEAESEESKAESEESEAESEESEAESDESEAVSVESDAASEDSGASDMSDVASVGSVGSDESKASDMSDTTNEDSVIDGGDAGSKSQKGWLNRFLGGKK